MLISVKLAILPSLEDTRDSDLGILGIEARDSIWMVSIALYRRANDESLLSCPEAQSRRGRVYRAICERTRWKAERHRHRSSQVLRLFKRLRKSSRS